MSLSQCALCSDTHFSSYLKVGNRQIVKCLKCGFLFAPDVPSTMDIKLHYSQVMNPDYLGKYSEIADRRGRLILRYLGNQGRDMLDVGCGLGSFLGLAKEKGYTPHGIELSAEASEHARRAFGVEVFTGDVREFPATGEMFDVVTIQHVLEHVPDPREFMKHIYSLLKKNGILVVVVPNANSLVARLARGKWLGFATDEHVCHYTKKTLLFLMEKCGFVAGRVLAPQWDTGDLLWAMRIYATRDSIGPVRADKLEGSNVQRSFVKKFLIKLFYPLAWIVSWSKAGQELILFSSKHLD